MKKQLFYSLLVLLFATSKLTLMGQEQKRPTFNHMALYVTDLQKSTWFYKEVLGLETMPEPFHDGRHSWFKVGDHSQLHLISGAKTAKEHEKDTHLCFSVPQLEDITGRLEKYKIPYENWAGESNKQTKRADGVMQIYLKDPDGFWVEINNDSF